MATKESMMSFIHKSPKSAEYEAYKPDEEVSAYEDSTPRLEILSCPVVTTKKIAVVSGTLSGDEKREPRLYVNEKEVVVRGGKWLASLKIEDGMNRIVIMATNNTGKTVFTSRDVYCGMLPPRLEVNPVPELTSKPVVTISGTVTDLNAAAVGLSEVSVNDNQVDVGADGKWTYQASTKDGENIFIIVAKNGSQLPAVVKKTFIKSAGLPDFCLTECAEASPVNMPVISGMLVSPEGSKKCKLRVNDQEVPVAGDGSFITKVKLKKNNTPTTFTIIGDSTYNINKKINFDPPSPVNVITKCEPSQKRILYRLSGTATDESGSITAIIINGKDITVNNGAWSTILNLKFGFNPIEVIAKNPHGKTSALYGCIYIEQRPPVLEITNCPKSTKATEAEISGIVKDADAEIPPVVTVNDEKAEMGVDTWKITIPLVPGINPVKVVAMSNTGKSTEVETEINCAFVIPSLKILNCPRQTDSPSLILRGFARSGYMENLHAVKVTVNGKPVDFSEGKWTHQVTLKPGGNTFVIAAENEDGECVKVEKQVVLNT